MRRDSLHSCSEPVTLRPNAVGMPAVLFQSITTMAPASAVAFSLGAAIPFAGAALPLAVCIALLICSLIALNIGSLARYLPSAGGYLTYVSRGLGPVAGWLTGWLFSIALITPIQFLVLGTVADSLARQYFHVALGWALWMLLFAALISGLTYCGIKVSTSANIILGTIEIAVFLLLAIWLLATAGTSTTVTPFTPGSSYEAGLGGWQGILHGMIFAFLAFAGFEASAPLAEEVRDPRRTVPRAILLATIAIGLFYIFCSYAGVIGWGITHLSTYSRDSNPWGTMAHRLWGLFGVIVLLALLNSALVNANAIMIAASRVLYAMGRTRTLPGVLGHISPRFRTPDVAILTTTIIGITFTISLGLVYTPLTAFALLGTMITILYLLVYFLTCLAVPFFYWREHRGEFHVVRHLLLPGISMLVLIFPLYAQFAPAPSPPLNLAGPICAAWVVLGLLIVAILRWRAPHDLTLVNKVYLGE